MSNVSPIYKGSDGYFLKISDTNEGKQCIYTYFHIHNTFILPHAKDTG